MNNAREFLDWATTRRIAVLADVDPRSVDRVLTGKPTRDSVRLRIVAALDDCGLSSLVSPTPNEPSDAAPEAPGTP